mmetsp:Transcript_14354/g.60481  ORF Transcript_14354/g.60481 Transcript_14354/m.60481 type:complete len:271 (-) Transcript_14354:341-1153(-)
MVMEVSAMLVARITLRAPRRGRSKISRWCAEGICPCRGRIRNRDASPSTSSDAHRSRTFTISSHPVRKIRTAPAANSSGFAVSVDVSPSPSFSRARPKGRPRDADASRRSVSSASATTRRKASRTSSTSSASSAAQFAVHRRRFATTSGAYADHSGGSPSPSSSSAFRVSDESRGSFENRPPRPRPRARPRKPPGPGPPLGNVFSRGRSRRSRIATDERDFCVTPFSAPFVNEEKENTSPVPDSRSSRNASRTGCVNPGMWNSRSRGMPK